MALSNQQFSLFDLPGDVILHIATFLHLSNMIHLAKTSKGNFLFVGLCGYYNEFSSAHFLWQVKFNSKQRQKRIHYHMRKNPHSHDDLLELLKKTNLGFEELYDTTQSRSDVKKYNISESQIFQKLQFIVLFSAHQEDKDFIFKVFLNVLDQLASHHNKFSHDKAYNYKYKLLELVIELNQDLDQFKQLVNKENDRMEWLFTDVNLFNQIVSLIIFKGRLDVLRFFEEQVSDELQKAEFRQNWLNIAASFENADEIVSYLIARKNINYYTPIQIAGNSNNLNIVKLLTDQAKDSIINKIFFNTCFATYITKHFFQIIQLLVEHGAKISSKVLSLAVKTDHLEMTQFLLEHKATPDAEKSMSNLLNLALENESVEMIVLLFKNGASIDHYQGNFLRINFRNEIQSISLYNNLMNYEFSDRLVNCYLLFTIKKLSQIYLTKKDDKKYAALNDWIDQIRQHADLDCESHFKQWLDSYNNQYSSEKNIEIFSCPSFINKKAKCSNTGFYSSDIKSDLEFLNDLVSKLKGYAQQRSDKKLSLT